MQNIALNGAQPCIKNPIQPYQIIGEEERQVADYVMRSKNISGFLGAAHPNFYGGKQVKALEHAWCERFGVKHAISMNSATSCLIAAMGAIGIEPGDEVIVPPYTMSATAVAPLFYGGIPIFVDIEADYFCLDVNKVAQAITPKTKAIIAVNIFGHPAECKKLKDLAKKHNIYLIEDNAQAITASEDGARCGTISDIGIYSLNVHKHIHSGEGGVCVTQNNELAKRLGAIRNHGENVTEWLQIENLSNILGFNFRLTELQAAIANAQLNKLDMAVSRCEDIGQQLTEILSDYPGLTPPKVRDKCTHNYYMWSAHFDEKQAGFSRDLFIRAILAEGVPMAAGYVAPLYRLPMFQNKIAIGSRGYPFNLGNPDYAPSQFPIVEMCHFKTVVQFQPPAWNVQREHITQIRQAFDKLFSTLPTKEPACTP